MPIITAECPKNLRAMTCHAPFAYALALGKKREEYRSRETKYRGWVLFHSGLSTASDYAFEYLDMSPQDAKRGYIIGAGYLNHCSKTGISWAYEMINPVLFEKPLKIKGKQPVLWTATNSNEAQIFAGAWQILQTMIHTAK